MALINFEHFIDPWVFIISLSIGLIISYIVTPEPEVIIQYPKPGDDTVYASDDGSSCYRYKSKEVTCPADKSKIIDPVKERKGPQTIWEGKPWWKAALGFS